ncbi:trypsin-like serine peptidase [Pseudarthrobacter sp. NPDC058329]|uniref:trypsin-like serine peptidase n=1 Tax=Pseudarthrobacter sp. NPDC058329 TaxID=3346448 RepID=UPI0036DDD124
MIRTRSLVSGFLSFSAAAALTLCSAGGATAAPAASDEKKTPTVVSAVVDSTGVADYWTADRMRQAVPGEVLSGKALERGNRSSVDTVKKGKSSKIKGTRAKAEAPATVKHIGKVFFTMGGANYVCSGNAVTSANRSTVATAGHCTMDGLGQEAENFAFVPAYENGERPYGTWTATALYAPIGWSSGGDMTYDTAFAVVAPDETGRLLTDVVGGSGVAFNQAKGQYYTSYGYPASSPFTGETLRSCAGTARPDTINPGFGTQGIPCDMNGGSSGGPWLIGSGPGGFQNSINSYGYKGSKVLYGPAWDDVIKDTYTVAQASL